MLHCVEVVVPGPWWNTLTYLYEGSSAPREGARVKVPLGRGKRVGFVLSCSEPPPVLPKGLKTVEEVLDEESILGEELWELAGWIGKTFLCGRGEALQIICPNPLLQGETFQPCRPAFPSDRTFLETPFFHPWDGERFVFYREKLALEENRVLLLFPETQVASNFWAALSEGEKKNALLWPSTGGKRLWNAWKKVASDEIRVVVGTGGAVFAPSYFDTVIVDDEANPGYVFLRAPRISARSLAGRRALSMRAQLILGGRMPSAKTYLRSRPRCDVLPQRRNFVVVDIRRSLKAEVRGIEGDLFITRALLERTRNTLDGGRHVFWIMDRKGQAGEVYCSDCGSSLSCPRCGSVMRSQSSGKPEKRGGNGENATDLCCVKCGLRTSLSLKCPACKGTLLLGKRPGLEALLPWAERYLKGRPVLLDGTEKKYPGGMEASLVLGTRRLLSLCDSLDAGLVAWLDLDAEARKVEYNARFQTFSMVWESYWRGRRKDAIDERMVLVQTRRPGSGWQNALWLGWDHFWQGELQERKNLLLPPYGLLIQLDLPKSEDRTALIRLLEQENFPVMDAGDGVSPFWLTTKSTERLSAVLAPRFEIKFSRIGFPVATVWTE